MNETIQHSIPSQHYTQLHSANCVANMGKASKATKKFEKKHLKETIDRRKDFAKIKQRHQVKDKRKARNAKKNASNDVESGEEEEVDAKDDVNQDEFFQDQIVVPQGKNAKKRKHNGEVKEESAPVESEVLEDGLESSADEELDMQAVINKDPEFKKYLQQEDPELLDFNEDDNLDEFMSEDDERPNKKRKTDQPHSQEVSLDVVKKWQQSMTEQHSLRALREIVLAFRSAAHMGDQEKEYKYTIPSSEVYHEVLITALKEMPKVLAHHLPVKETAAGKLRIPTDSPIFKRLSPLIRTYSTSLNHLLSTLSDSATMRLTLESFEPLLPYLLQHRKFLKQIIRSISSIWADNTSTEAVRIAAFLILRRLLTIGDAGLRETVLKSCYEFLIKSSRNTTVHTLPGINLMKNSAAELYGIDQKQSYTVAFQFIRQAAIHLRTNITKPSKESYKTLYNWQFIHSLDFWSRVLSMHCNSLLEAQNGKASELRPLIYPVVQITLGVMRLIPTPTYYPLRFHLIRSLLRISQSTGTYIPLGSPLLEVLSHPDLRKPAKNNKNNTNLRPLDFTTHIRAPTAYLKTRIYQTSLGEQLLELLSDHLALWCTHISYPELSLPLTVTLKRWLKHASSPSTGNKNASLNQALLLLVHKSEANAKWIQTHREKISFAPRDRAQVERFLDGTGWEVSPLGAFVKGQRELREQRSRVVEQGRKEEEKIRKRRKADREEEDGVDEDNDIEVS